MAEEVNINLRFIDFKDIHRLADTILLAISDLAANQLTFKNQIEELKRKLQNDG